MFICGDINARVGNMLDYIENIDDIQLRNILDTSKNNHGHALIDFAHESKFCECKQ